MAQILLDGVYRLTDGIPVFQPIPGPATEQLLALLTRIISRLLKALTRYVRSREKHRFGVIA